MKYIIYRNNADTPAIAIDVPQDITENLKKTLGTSFDLYVETAIPHTTYSTYADAPTIPQVNETALFMTAFNEILEAHSEEEFQNSISRGDIPMLEVFDTNDDTNLVEKPMCVFMMNSLFEYAVLRGLMAIVRYGEIKAYKNYRYHIAIV